MVGAWGLARSGNIEPALALFAAVHAGWITLLDSISLAALGRTFEHPESNMTARSADMLPNSAWHCCHHTEMIRWRRDTESWNG